MSRFNKSHTEKITTLGGLKKAGYRAISVKDELRNNLIAKIKSGQEIFHGIRGYEDTVIPELERAILSRHSINLLGLRGQAKTRLARLMINLLDEYMPVVAGSEINDDPLHPISAFAIQTIAELGDNTPVEWIHRSARYTEKLATPDVSVADLIGDADPIKAANLKLPYSDERVIHFGLIPRSHRGIFVINELPDLQARIQVALFNILQEGDIQIRGFKIRMPLDIQFVFTANPEDYTNRGSIVTPLKDRIESQIITHYPKSIEIGKQITKQEADLKPEQQQIEVPVVAAELIEQLAFEARDNEYVDAKSGVSARLTISAYESLVSTAERRMLLNGETSTTVRISDFAGVVPAITGKVELVYEGETEGARGVAKLLIAKAHRSLFPVYFPDPSAGKKKKSAESPYLETVKWFRDGNTIDLMREESNKEYEKKLKSVPGLADTVEKYHPTLPYSGKLLMMEWILFALAEFSSIAAQELERGLAFKDLLDGMLNMKDTGFDFGEKGLMN